MNTGRRGEIMRALRAQGWTADDLAREIRDMLHGGGGPGLTERERIENKKWAAEFIRKASEHEEGARVEISQPPADFAEALRRIRAVFAHLVEIGALRQEALTFLNTVIVQQTPAIETTAKESDDGPKTETFV